MSSRWGRIDADGTVYVRTGDGERAVGSWQAGDAAAGLAYFEQRLQSGAADPVATRSQATELRGQLTTASVVGDVGALEVRLAALVATADELIDARAAAREQARADAIAAK